MYLFRGAPDKYREMGGYLRGEIIFYEVFVGNGIYLKKSNLNIYSRSLNESIFIRYNHTNYQK